MCLDRGRTVLVAVGVLFLAKPLLPVWPFRVPGLGMDLCTLYQPTSRCGLLPERRHGSSFWPRAVPGEGRG